jgi:hypothetical protein
MTSARRWRSIPLSLTISARREMKYFTTVRFARVLALAAALTMFPNAQRSAAAETPAASAPANPLAEVTVTARRIELEKRVSKFVNQIAATENGDEGLARWQVPSACPLVSGLPRQDGEFILERLSEIARVAGVPIGDEHCHPNLYILVTSQPEDLLRGMEKRNRSFTFGYNSSSREEMPSSVVDEFIRTPHPVRVWYNSAEKDAWGQALSYCPAMEIALISCSPNDTECHPPHFNPSRVYQCGRAVAGGTHLSFNDMWWFSRVFVIVDQRLLQEVNLGQLADYIAMSGFAKLKPDARLGDFPTILTLFNGAPKAAPSGMTDWDQAFLKSLYATEQKSKLQRSQMTHQMVREIAP